MKKILIMYKDQEVDRIYFLSENYIAFHLYGDSEDDKYYGVIDNNYKFYDLEESIVVYFPPLGDFNICFRTEDRIIFEKKDLITNKEWKFRYSLTHKDLGLDESNDDLNLN